MKELERDFKTQSRTWGCLIMDYRAFEQRLLETIFTTDVPITPATMAYLYRISTEHASELLQKAAVAGVLTLDSDEEGNLIYQYPNRTKIQPHGAARAPMSNQRFGIGAFLAPSSQVAAPMTNIHAIVGQLSPVESMPFHPAQEIGAEGMEKVGGAGMDSQQQPKVTRCPFCYQTVLLGSKKCAHCHEYLDYALRELYGKKPSYLTHQDQTRALLQSTTTGGQAALLSFFMPGLGQMCKGQIGIGIIWMILTCLSYAVFSLPGAIIHLLCIIHAARQIPTNAGTIAS